MKIINRQLSKTVDINADRGKTFSELMTLSFFALVSIVVLYVGIGIIIEFLINRISYEQEKKLFTVFNTSDFFPQKELDQDITLSREKVNSILNTLKKHPDTPQLEFTLVILDNADLNAFAFPGGIIGVTTGLLKQIKGEVELAFILSHEIGHFQNRDHLRNFGRGVGFMLCYSLVFGGEMSSDSLLKILLSVLESSHSQEQELKADRFAIKLVYDQFGTTQGFNALFDFLNKQKNHSNWDYMLSTHPSPSDRINKLQTYIKDEKLINSVK